MTKAFRCCASVFLFMGLALGLGTNCFATTQAAATPSRAFTETNSATGNAVLVYNRSTTDGSLTLAQTVSTRQNGSGSLLQEQGALLIVSHFLLAVNAGSNSISVLNIGGPAVRWLGNYNSGGTSPKSLTAYQNTIYVLNQGGSGNINGFTFDRTSGVLTPIPGSTQPLSGASSPQPVQIGFVGNGFALVVTERATVLMDVYPVNSGGVAGSPAIWSNPGPNPCGFVTDNKARIYIAAAGDGNTFSGSVSSFAMTARRDLVLLTGAAGTTQGGTSSIAMNPAGSVLWATDNTSNAISPLLIDSTGHVTVDFSSTIGTPSSPYDIARSGDGLNVYVLYLNPAQIITYTVSNGEELVPGPGVSVTSMVAAGLVVQ